MRDDSEHLFPHVVAVDTVDVETVEHLGCRGHPRLLVVDRSNSSIDESGRRWLAEIMADRSEHHDDLSRAIQIVDPRSRLIDNEQCMDPHVPLGMPLGLLLAADERVDFWKQTLDHSKVERQL